MRAVVLPKNLTGLAALSTAFTLFAGQVQAADNTDQVNTDTAPVSADAPLEAPTSLTAPMTVSGPATLSVPQSVTAPLTNSSPATRTLLTALSYGKTITVPPMMGAPAWEFSPTEFCDTHSLSTVLLKFHHSNPKADTDDVQGVALCRISPKVSANIQSIAFPGVTGSAPFYYVMNSNDLKLSGPMSTSLVVDFLRGSVKEGTFGSSVLVTPHGEVAIIASGAKLPKPDATHASEILSVMGASQAEIDATQTNAVNSANPQLIAAVARRPLPEKLAKGQLPATDTAAVDEAFDVYRPATDHGVSAIALPSPYPTSQQTAEVNSPPTSVGTANTTPAKEFLAQNDTTAIANAFGDTPAKAISTTPTLSSPAPTSYASVSGVISQKLSTSVFSISSPPPESAPAEKTQPPSDQAAPASTIPILLAKADTEPTQAVVATTPSVSDQIIRRIADGHHHLQGRGKNQKRIPLNNSTVVQNQTPNNNQAVTKLASESAPVPDNPSKGIQNIRALGDFGSAGLLVIAGVAAAVGFRPNRRPKKKVANPHENLFSGIGDAILAGCAAAVVGASVLGKEIQKRWTTIKTADYGDLARTFGINFWHNKWSIAASTGMGITTSVVAGASIQAAFATAAAALTGTVAAAPIVAAVATVAAAATTGVVAAFAASYIGNTVKALQKKNWDLTQIGKALLEAKNETFSRTNRKATLQFGLLFGAIGGGVGLWMNAQHAATVVHSTVQHSVNVTPTHAATQPASIHQTTAGATSATTPNAAIRNLDQLMRANVLNNAHNAALMQHADKLFAGGHNVRALAAIRDIVAQGISSHSAVAHHAAVQLNNAAADFIKQSGVHGRVADIITHNKAYFSTLGLG